MNSIMQRPTFWIVFLVAAFAAFFAVNQSGMFAPKGEYAYRCADGTEFTMTPSDDAASLTLYPATSVERIPQTVLHLVESDFGTRFESSDGLVFHGQGESVQLIGKSFSTICTPVSDTESPPYNWGD